MFYRLLKLIPLSLATILLVFNVRRIVFTLTILLKRDRAATNPPLTDFPTLLILVPCRDEEKVIGDLCERLTRLNYPREKLQVVLIDDDSRDTTCAVMEEWARGRNNWHVLSLTTNLGKSRALNAALDQFAFGDIIYVFDADHRPQADVLEKVVKYFDDPQVAGVSGRTIPSNGLVSPSAYYATVESLVHQMLTMRAKDQLNLAPALLGSNCGYRRAVLDACGRFRAGAFLEDSDLTLKIYRAGYHIRFAPDAIAYHQVPETVRGYLRQHARWARGFNDVAGDHAIAVLTNARLALPLRTELFLFSVGYFDRLALIGAGLLTSLAYLSRHFVFPRRILLLALLTPLAQIVALFFEQRVALAMWIRLPLVPIFFALDIFAALRALRDSILNRTRVWTKTERTVDDQRRPNGAREMTNG
jgi:cellulose synthase/poly-beta-1,6-N-acetylglucosamine synthase-like glycosyltransferase